jgi:hypothetical protein
MMNDWYERSMKALQLNGLSYRTQESYTRMVRGKLENWGHFPVFCRNSCWTQRKGGSVPIFPQRYFFCFHSLSWVSLLLRQLSSWA